MNKNNQAGFTQILMLILLLVGIGAGVYLTLNQTFFRSKADQLLPSAPETSFTLVPLKPGCANVFNSQDRTTKVSCDNNFNLNNLSGIIKGENSPAYSKVVLNIYARSDIDAANVFAAKLKFDPSVLQVTAIQIAPDTTSQPKSQSFNLIPKVEAASDYPGDNKNCSSSNSRGDGCSCTAGARNCYFMNCGDNGICGGTNSVCGRPGGCTKPTPTTAPTPSPTVSPSPLASACSSPVANTCAPGKRAVTQTQNGCLVSNCVNNDNQPYFIQNWLDQSFDNQAGTVSLVGGLPDPGYKTVTGKPSPLMAVVVFSVLKQAKTTISVDNLAGIYRNSDNVNILIVKNNADIDTTTPKASNSPEASSDSRTVENQKCGKNQNDTSSSCLPNSKTNPNAAGKSSSIYACKYPTENTNGKATSLFVTCGYFSRVNDIPNGWQIPTEPGLSGLGEGNNSSITNPTISAASNQYGTASLSDLSAVFSRLNKKSQTGNKYDLNKDGSINSFDVALMRLILVNQGVLK